jgi:hypothetical protein
MADAVGAVKGNVHAGLVYPSFEDVDDARWLQGAVRGTDAEKELAIGKARAFLEICNQYFRDIIGQWKCQAVACLLLGEGDDALSPIDIIESESGHFTGAKPIGGYEVQQGVIPHAQYARSIYGPDKGIDRLPWKRTGKLLEPINSRRVDHGVKRRHENAPFMAILEEGTQVGDHVLKRVAVVGLCTIRQKVVHCLY